MCLCTLFIMEPSIKRACRDIKEELKEEPFAFPTGVSVAQPLPIPEVEPCPYYPPDCVYPGLYIGDARNAKNRKELAELGVEGIICCILSLSASTFVPGLNYLYLNWKEGRRIEQLEQDIKTINIFIAKHQEKKLGVLVHDQMSISLASVAIIGHLMTTKNLSYEAALSILKKEHPEAQPSPLYVQQLKELE